jgi:hypothetical protein
MSRTYFVNKGINIEHVYINVVHNSKHRLAIIYINM